MDEAVVSTDGDVEGVAQVVEDGEAELRSDADPVPQLELCADALATAVGVAVPHTDAVAVRQGDADELPTVDAEPVPHGVAEPHAVALVDRATVADAVTDPQTLAVGEALGELLEELRNDEVGLDDAPIAALAEPVEDALKEGVCDVDAAVLAEGDAVLLRVAVAVRLGVVVAQRVVVAHWDAVTVGVAEVLGVTLPPVLPDAESEDELEAVLESCDDAVAVGDSVWLRVVV